MDRRKALKLIALSAAGPALETLSPSQLLAVGHEAHVRAQDSAELRILSSEHHRTVLAAIERIIPESDTPGAVAAGVDRFIDLILTEWYSDEERERVLAGLDSLGIPFVEDSVEEQTRLLESIDRAAVDDPDHWFSMLKYLTIWGYFTSEMGVTQELAKYARSGKWQGCAKLPSVGGHL